VRASVAGRVSDRRVSVGDVVTAGSTLLTRVVTLDPIWFSFEGAESFYLKYLRQDRTGERRSSRYEENPVEIQLADETGYPHRGRMVFVDNAIDTRSGTIRALAELPNADKFLTPGMFGRVRLLGSGTYHAMLIPDESIVADQARKLAYVVQQDGKVAARVVETGPMVTGLRVVRSGLKNTDQVVLDGLAQLQPGATVRPKLTEIKTRAEDTSPSSQPLSATPPSQATPP
jgi:RND family efflux transporter MFP subunit